EPPRRIELGPFGRDHEALRREADPAAALEEGRADGVVVADADREGRGASIADGEETVIGALPLPDRHAPAPGEGQLGRGTLERELAVGLVALVAQAEALEHPLLVGGPAVGRDGGA